MALAFTSVGGGLAFGRSWITLDMTARTVGEQWGLLFPLRARTYPIGGYTAVTLGLIRGDSDTADRFPVALKAPSGANLPLCSYTTYSESRDCAIAVARHLRLEIEDASTDHQVRVSAADAERSIRQRTIDPAREADVPRPGVSDVTWLFASYPNPICRVSGSVCVVTRSALS